MLYNSVIFIWITFEVYCIIDVVKQGVLFQWLTSIGNLRHIMPILLALAMGTSILFTILIDTENQHKK